MSGWGRAYLNADQNDKAVTAFDKAVEIDPSPLVFNDVAYELARKQVSLDRALQYAESAVEATNSTSPQSESRSPDGPADDPRHQPGRILGHASDGSTSSAANCRSRKNTFIVRGMLNAARRGRRHLGQIYEREGRKQDAIST